MSPENRLQQALIKVMRWQTLRLRPTNTPHFCRLRRRRHSEVVRIYGDIPKPNIL